MDDVAYSIQQNDDGGYIIAGSSLSDDGDVMDNYGSWDFWIVKLTPTDELASQKNLGRSNYDLAYSIQQTIDEGYIISGYSNSNDGDISGTKYSFYYIMKLSVSGELEWQKTYGGSSTDRPYSIKQTTEGGYFVAGYTLSKDGDVTESHGFKDYWIIKLTTTGELVWQKTLGGSYNDEAHSIQQNRGWRIYYCRFFTFI